MKNPIQGMIFAAGLGTRFKPWTDTHPKALAIINGKSLLQRNIEYLQRYGISEVIVNVHHFSNQIIDTLDKTKGWGSKIIISDETDEVLETGGGLKKAAPLFNAETIAIINADILTDLDLGKMISYHQEKKPVATLATTNRKTSRYFLFNDQQVLCGWRNTNTGEEKISRATAGYEQRAFSGIHIIHKKLLSLIQFTGKFSMVDVYLDLARTEKILSFDHSGSRFIDVGKPEAVAAAERLFEN